MEKQDCTALTLLDLSAAFDTIDHRILLDRLKEWFGLDDVALDWVVSYLKHLFQSVQISSTRSNPIELIFGVPQGSVLGPLLFIMYTTPLSSVLSKAKDIKHHLYADETQVHNSPVHRNRLFPEPLVKVVAAGGLLYNSYNTVF